MELFQDIDDPIAAAEGENITSQMRSAELQLASDLAGNDPDGFEAGSFEREAINIGPQDDFGSSSSVEADSNRSACLCRCLKQWLRCTSLTSSRAWAVACNSAGQCQVPRHALTQF